MKLTSSKAFVAFCFSLLNVTSTNSNSCTYGTGINLPTNPTKTGYKFTGWKVVPQYDFSTLPTDIPQRSCGRYSKGYDSSIETEVCGWGENGECTSDFDDLNINEWKTTCGFGTVYGMALCSSTAGGGALQAGTPSESTPGGYCWCKVTGFIPTGQTIKYKSTNTPWVALGPYTNCLSSCIVQCQPTVNQTYRAILFGKQSS